jgi:16S rRNA processing protein RimM
MSGTTKANQPQYLLIGEILRPHGVVGEMRMRILTSYPEHLSDLKTVYLADNPDSSNVTEYTLEHVRMHQQYALLKLKTITDRDQAERLRQLLVMVAIDDAVPLEEGELYLYQLIGLQVQMQDGTLLGNITDVLETGANDVYIIQSEKYGEILFPATDQTIISTDIETGIMIVNPPEGLIPSA